MSVNPRIITSAIGLTAAGLVLGLGVGTATAAPAARPASFRLATALGDTSPLESTRLSNLTESQLDGAPVLMLRNAAPSSAPDAVYYTLDPATGQPGAGFISPDGPQATVTDAAQVMIAPPSTGTGVEIRYGQVTDGAHGRLVAVATDHLYQTQGLSAETQQQFNGDSFTAFYLTADPQVSGEGKFFLYDTVGQKLVTFASGDIRRRSVDSWTEARFTPPATGTYEVRYGDPLTPNSGQTIASATLEQ